MILLALVAAPASAAPPGAVTQKLPGRVAVDWTAARLSATGAGAPDLRAPGPEVARVGAERAARREAGRRLAEAARALPLADGGTVGERAAADAATEARVAAILANPVEVDVSYASDGAVDVTLAVPLEGLRLAVVPTAAPAADAAAPTALIVDARAAGVAPILGLTLSSGAARYRGPTVWHRDAVAAAADSRAGARVASVAAAGPGPAGGTLEVTMDPAQLEAAARSGALVEVIVP